MVLQHKRIQYEARGGNCLLLLILEVASFVSSVKSSLSPVYSDTTQLNSTQLDVELS